MNAIFWKKVMEKNDYSTAYAIFRKIMFWVTYKIWIKGMIFTQEIGQLICIGWYKTWNFWEDLVFCLLLLLLMLFYLFLFVCFQFYDIFDLKAPTWFLYFKYNFHKIAFYVFQKLAPWKTRSRYWSTNDSFKNVINETKGQCTHYRQNGKYFAVSFSKLFENPLF